MKNRILNVSPHRTALSVALTLAVVVLVLAIPFSLVTLFLSGAGDRAINLSLLAGLVVGMPVAYFVMTYIMVGVAASIYNLVARLTGGIEYETDRSAARPET
ncbi:MAG: hypothetical protein ACFHX7_14350 [Pseudomonadota bacterium]